jgi:hypothetical protein
MRHIFLPDKVHFVIVKTLFHNLVSHTFYERVRNLNFVRR